MSVKRSMVFLVATAASTSPILACSGDGVTGAAKARAVLQANFDTPDQTDCSAAGASVGVGAFRDPPVPIDDGMQVDGGVNHVACRVADLGGDRFVVEGTVKSDDRMVFEIKGTFPKSTDAKGFKADRVTLSNGKAGTDLAVFTQADGQCTVLYSTEKMGATAGRVWGEVTCAAATRDPAAGGAAAGTCITIAQFRFEDCAK